MNGSRPDAFLRTGEKVSRYAYQCAMTWALMGGETSYLTQISQSFGDAQGFALQRAMISAVISYRASNPSGPIDLQNAPNGLRQSMLQAAIGQLGAIRESFNNSQIPIRIAEHDIRQLIITMASSGLDQAGIREQLSGFQDFGIGQYAFDNLLDDIWRSENPVTAFAIDTVMGLPLGVLAPVRGAGAVSGARQAGLKEVGKVAWVKGIPVWLGSGPQKGIIGINKYSVSNKALLNSPSRGFEFVFDPRSGTFLIATGRTSGSHAQLARSIGVSSSDDVLVGGMFARDSSGRFLTSEFSGHYGRNWTPAVRKQFYDTMKKYGIDIRHSAW